MNKRNLQNEELDRIGRKLLDAAKVRSDEIEQIIGSPLLVDAVKARIETERRERNLKKRFRQLGKLSDLELAKSFGNGFDSFHCRRD